MQPSHPVTFLETISAGNCLHLPENRATQVDWCSPAARPAIQAGFLLGVCRVPPRSLPVRSLSTRDQYCWGVAGVIRREGDDRSERALPAGAAAGAEGV